MSQWRRRGLQKAPGPRPMPEPRCLQGSLFVLHTGISWENLPGFGSGTTCWRRLQCWTEAGVFDQVPRYCWAG
ncbi:transposase [Actinoplanes aureus]|nr:transposase [Actinoplanes aureus]